ncbi:PCTP protein [Brachionus plicatilis]|uniref:PCTP protein n=1 Tax=Brachionus plicatilis TaxID=10195 RepID=A0A3M7P867_BRAPC|nr:PCTP protein [Brachionus plicatilis]
MYKLGEVKKPSNKDFDSICQLCLLDEDWILNNSKKDLKVYTKLNDKCPFKMVKAKEYSDHWDERKEKSADICQISSNSDIIYYSVKMPKPFKNRDFVIQRFWKDYGENRDKVVFNHSVNHAKYPAKSDRVRGISYLTAVLIKPTSPRTCDFYFISQSDPGGLPVWIVNLNTKFYGPKFAEKMYHACLKYDRWKKKHNPDYMPWVHPEQNKSPFLDWIDIKKLDKDELKNTLTDESKVEENQIEV